MISRANKINLGEKIVFRLKDIPSVFSGTVDAIDDEGLWIKNSKLIDQVRHDQAWGPMLAEVGKSVMIFVPTSSLLFLMVAEH